MARLNMPAPVAARETARPKPAARPAESGRQSDGTRQLLLGGCWTLITGVLAALATQILFGGIGDHGPHTNSGWLSLIVAMMCLPFGSLLFLLGGAKWLRNRRLERQRRR
jgi:drug/metabolite transporter (DMT)-like permease